MTELFASTEVWIILFTIRAFGDWNGASTSTLCIIIHLRTRAAFCNRRTLTLAGLVIELLALRTDGSVGTPTTAAIFIKNMQIGASCMTWTCASACGWIKRLCFQAWFGMGTLTHARIVVKVLISWTSQYFRTFTRTGTADKDLRFGTYSTSVRTLTSAFMIIKELRFRTDGCGRRTFTSAYVIIEFFISKAFSYMWTSTLTDFPIKELLWRTSSAFIGAFTPAIDIIKGLFSSAF